MRWIEASRRTTVFLVLLGLVAVPSGAAESADVVLQMIEAINDRDLDRLDAVVAPGINRYCAATPGVTVENLDQFKSLLEQDFATFPDSKIVVNLSFDSADMVAVHATYSGTQSGPMGPFQASGRHMEIPFISVLRLEAGMIVEMWVEWDNLGILRQLGHSPPGGDQVDGSAASSR